MGITTIYSNLSKSKLNDHRDGSSRGRNESRQGTPRATKDPLGRKGRVNATDDADGTAEDKAAQKKTRGFGKKGRKKKQALEATAGAEDPVKSQQSPPSS